MMFGGIFMMFLGLLALLLIIAIPIALIIMFIQRPTGTSEYGQRLIPLAKPYSPLMPLCKHCSQPVQSDWAHCPFCGAPTH